MALMEKPTEAPFGAWKSPLTADFVSGASKRLEGAVVDSQGRLLWLEGRPSKRGGAQPGDVTPEGFNVRTVVHEYGGAAFKLVNHGDAVVFSNFADQRLYKQSLDGDRSPVALTPLYEVEQSVRYADGEYDAKFDRMIIVREDARQSGVEATTEIVAVNLKGDPNTEPKVLINGNDFYAFPRRSPDGSKLAWMEWSHPNMPFDHSSIWVGEVSPDGDIVNPVCVAGGDADVVEAPTGPRWSPQGDLFFVSDRGSGFWNLYSWTLLRPPDSSSVCHAFSSHLHNIVGYQEGRQMRVWQRVPRTDLWAVGQWGIVDVNDCSSCAEYLASIGEADANRLCRDGFSAGGYTTMASLVFSNTFNAGASLYGLSELTVFITETHKFESRYVQNLVGTDNMEKNLYERSPINHLDKLTCPIILFQGLEDKVVPPNQARLIYEAVKEKGIPVALVEYEGEQHGFLKAENVRNTMEQEMVFFARLIGGFQVADDITPIKVDNFDD